MKRYLPIIALSIALMALSIWLLSYGLDQRRVYYGDYEYGEMDAASLAHIPEVLFTFGETAWRRLDPERSADFFRQAVARDPVHMGAWLKLAQAEIESGDTENARKIAAFCNTQIAPVLRWKLAHTLLAHDLDMKGIFRDNINYLVQRQKWLPDIFFLLDSHTHNRTKKALAMLAPGNRKAYMEWLMRWKRADHAHIVWEAIQADGDITDGILEKYVNFLVSQKNMVMASFLWRQHTGIHGMTNAGFEEEILQHGFGWRIINAKDDRSWQSRRVYGQSYQGAHSLRTAFHGRENLSWGHIYQVVPVTPGQSSRLTFWWRSKGITTDQGPFVEIYGYDVRGFYKKSPMIIGSLDWTSQAVEFIPPVDCHAIVVRLRRNTSLRFDNKIQGILWLDAFKIEEISDGKLAVGES